MTDKCKTEAVGSVPALPYFLAHVSIPFARSEEEQSTVLDLNIPFSSQTAYISQAALARLSQIAMMQAAKVAGQTEGLVIGDVLIKNIMPLGYMTAEQWGDIAEPMQVGGAFQDTTIE